MNKPVISSMLFRAKHCRRLAVSIKDERTVQALLSMAQEIEADAKRLEDDGGSDAASIFDPAPHDHAAAGRNVNIEVACTACGSNRFLCRGDDAEESEVVCSKCGQIVGTMGSVKQAIATVIIERETIARGSESGLHSADEIRSGQSRARPK